MSFLQQCKINYTQNITPANPNDYSKEGYKKLVDIAKCYFKSNDYEGFAGYLMEGEYLVSLWAAHLLLEYGYPNSNLKRVALDTIKDYAENSVLSKISQEESKWIILNADRYKI